MTFLDAKSSAQVDWEALLARVRAGEPILLRLDYLETTRMFVVVRDEAGLRERVGAWASLVGGAFRLYTNDLQHMPAEWPGGVERGQVSTLDLAHNPGYIEAALQLTEWSGISPAVLIAEVDGSGEEVAKHLGIPAKGRLSVKDVVHRYFAEAKIVQVSAEVTVPTKWGDFQMIGFTDSFGFTHTAIFKGDIRDGEPVLMRLHSECFTGDIFGSGRCDCGEQLDYAMNLIAEEGRGLVLYTRQEGRGIGLHNKLNAYMLQDAGYDTVEANHHLGFPGDARDYTVTLLMLQHLGIEKIRLITNNPRKWTGLGEYGIEVVERVPVHIEPGQFNTRYLQTKSRKLGHHLDHVESSST
jgi:3,4-dihydroxy 2-butanone 4-phosphate synthase/GTP cyclohydrolase II